MYSSFAHDTKLLKIIGIILVLCFQIEESVGFCPLSWSQFDGHCYKHFSKRLSFNDAKLRCEADQAILVTITSKEENTFVLNLGEGECHQSKWIGINDINNEGTFKWLDNEISNYSGWASNEPNDYKQAEDCTVIRCNGFWNDRHCDTDSVPGFICEKGRCPPYWSNFGDSCYYKHLSANSTFDSAKLRCEADNATLVSITSREENNFVLNLGDGPCQKSWIGLTDINNEGTFKWLGNETFNFSGWAPSEPNDGGGTEECVELLCNGFWNDKNCNVRRIPAFICEKDAITTLTPISAAVQISSLNYKAAMIFTNTGNKCLNSETLANLTIRQLVIRSRIKCFKFCIATNGCTAFQITTVQGNMTCYILRVQDEFDNEIFQQLGCVLYKFG